MNEAGDFSPVGIRDIVAAAAAVDVTIPAD